MGTMAVNRVVAPQRASPISTYAGLLFFFSSITILQFFMPTLVWAHRNDQPGILFLYYRQREEPYAEEIRAAAVSTLREQRSGRFDVYEDIVEGWSGANSENDLSLVNVLRQRYSRSNIHVVIPVGNTAFEFARIHARELFPEASIVYVTQSFATRSETLSIPGATGVIVRFDPEPTLLLALQQTPEAHHVVVVTGQTEIEKMELVAAQTVFRKYEDRLSFEYVTNDTYTQLLSRLSRLPNDAILIALDFAQDSAGDAFIPTQILGSLSQVATRPLYVVYDVGIGAGAVGGQVHDLRAVGREIGILATKVLNGTRADNLETREGTFLQPMFDWVQMQRWGISANKLPPGSVIVNRELTPWDRYKWWILSVLAIVAAQATLISLLIVARIRRARAENDLRYSEDLKARILDSLPANIAVVDSSGKIVATNKSWNEFWIANGGASDRLVSLGSNYLNDCQRAAEAGCEDASLAISGIASILGTKSDRFEMEYECSTPDQKRWFAMAAVPLLESHGAVVRHLDITISKQALLMVQESEQRFQEIADSAPVMIWIADAKQRYNYFSKPWLHFRGRSLEQECGNQGLDALHPDDVARCKNIRGSAFESRQPYSMEYRLRRCDGEYRWILESGVPRHVGGVFSGIIAACIDITEQKESDRVRAQLSGLLITAQEQERASIARELHDHINQRLALVAIELQGFQGVADLLSEKQQNELQHLWNLINEISHDVQALSHRLHSSQLEHLGLVAAIRNLCREFSKSSGVEAKCRFEGSIPKLDENISLAVFRVAQEALRNVAKYSRAKVVEVDLRGDQRGLTLRVTDNGVGFDPVGVTTSGLGLISMRERMRLVGGELIICSEHGAGTQIEARIPLVRELAETIARDSFIRVERRKRARA